MIVSLFSKHFFKNQCVYFRQHAYEIQVAQLQADIRGLENSQIQLEDVRKKAEAKSKQVNMSKTYGSSLCVSLSRSEIKRVLSEVSEQMEQQSSAQKYLEKLRTDNELVVIKDKERVVSKDVGYSVVDSLPRLLSR